MQSNNGLTEIPAIKRARTKSGEEDKLIGAAGNLAMTGTSSLVDNHQAAPAGSGCAERSRERLSPPPFHIDDIVQHPLPGYVAPAAIAFSSDDKLISYLFSVEGTLNRKLFTYDPDTMQQRLLVTPPGGGVEESNISKEEKLRRERLRERGLGVTRYDWAKSSSISRLLIPLPSGIFVQDGPGAELRLRVPATPGSPILDPQMSPDGSTVAYVRDDEMFVVPSTSGDPVQITFGAKASKQTHGLAEYIAQEEMERRNGFWWSPNSRFIAFAEVDASNVPLFRIMHQGKNSVGPDAEEDHSYPFAGQSNVKVKLGVVPVPGPGKAGGESNVVWMGVHCGAGDEDEEYLARVMWLPDGSLSAQIQNRAQTRLKLVKFDIFTGARQVLLVEENNTWINLHDCFTPLHKASGRLAGGFIWASEMSGFRHLYLHDGEGRQVSQLTTGDWLVEQVAGVDENAGLLYFSATAESPLECHLYCTPLWTAAPPGEVPAIRRLTRAAGKHVVVLDHQLLRFVDVHEALDRPPSVTLCSLRDGSPLVTIYHPPASVKVHHLQLQPPELVQVSTEDGTVLHGAIYRPNAAHWGPGPYRTVVSVYGGPHVQTVCNSWMTTVDMRAQYLRARGILVWKLDNRGSSRRGLKFEGVIKDSMGQIDVVDQERGVWWLIDQGLADAARIGIYGWSYGGYLALMALARSPGLFKCAVAGAPVTAWDGYDTHYTERYMGHPSRKGSKYAVSSVMHYVHDIRGELLLVHGMIDENVHFRHTARLVNALTACAKNYELLLFPDERHMPRGLRDRAYMEDRIFSFLDSHLSGELHPRYQQASPSRC